MSNSLAIAAVTSALRDLLNKVSERLPFDPDPESELAGAYCLTKPPDRALKPENENHLNLFLYQVTPNAAMRNLPMPGQSRPGELAEPPLALNLSYLLSAYGKGDDEVLSHRLLGRAMSILHDHASLFPGDFEASLKAANVQRQPERVRITPVTLSTEELSKLWTVFQTPYRVSAAYQVSVVLIDSAKPTQAAMPVLKRQLVGGGVHPNLLGPYPLLTDIALPQPEQPSARLNELLVFSGGNLDGDVTVRFSSALLPAPNTLTPVLGSVKPDTFKAQLPNDPDTWPAGPYSVDVQVKKTGEALRTSNALALSIAPKLVSVSATPRNAQNVTTVTAKVFPKVWPAQRVTLLIAGHEVVSKPHATKTDTLTFQATIPAAGSYFVRVRVDGVDSLVINYALTPPAFDATQQVTVT